MTRLKDVRMPEGKRKIQLGLLEAFSRNFFPMGFGYGFPDQETGKINFFSAQKMKNDVGGYKIVRKKRGRKEVYFIRSVNSDSSDQKLPDEIGALLYDFQEFERYMEAYRDCEARVHSLLDFTISNVISDSVVAARIKNYFVPDERFRHFFKEWKVIAGVKNESVKNREINEAADSRKSEVEKIQEMVQYLKDKFPGTYCFRFEKVLVDVLIETSKMMFVAL